MSHKSTLKKSDGTIVNLCIVCHKELSKEEDIERLREIETNFGWAKGKACNACYEIYKEKTVSEILGGK